VRWIYDVGLDWITPTKQYMDENNVESVEFGVLLKSWLINVVKLSNEVLTQWFDMSQNTTVEKMFERMVRLFKSQLKEVITCLCPTMTQI